MYYFLYILTIVVVFVLHVLIFRESLCLFVWLSEKTVTKHQ